MFHNCNSAGYNHPAFRKQFYGNMPKFMDARFGKVRPKYNVPLNVTETDKEFTVSLYATGFNKEEVKVTVVDDILHISGSKENVEATPFVIQEFPIKNFERRLLLNGLIDTEQISAKVENGVLLITLPKTPTAQKAETQIEVQ